jgi:spore coat protein JB
MFEHYNYFKNYETRDTRFYLALQGLSKGNMSQGLYDAFGNYVPKELPYNLENALRAYNFAIIDLGLYLDTHPDEANVKTLYDQYVAKFNEIKETYKKQNKMLDLKSPNKDKTWTWSKKFPWEGEM